MITGRTGYPGHGGVAFTLRDVWCVQLFARGCFNDEWEFDSDEEAFAKRDELRARGEDARVVHRYK